MVTDFKKSTPLQFKMEPEHQFLEKEIPNFGNRDFQVLR